MENKVGRGDQGIKNFLNTPHNTEQKTQKLKYPNPPLPT